MSIEDDRFTRACDLRELREAGKLVRRVDKRSLLLVLHEAEVFALDNRCPHMGFPLNRGSVQEGVLTCPWHHARFDLCSGGTFDPFADDAQAYPVEVRSGEVWVNAHSSRDESGHQKSRLADGLERNLGLVLAKACISLHELEVPTTEIVRTAALHGARQRESGWREGLTILTAMSNILPQLAVEDRPLALYHGALHIAREAAGRAPHFYLDALPSATARWRELRAWVRQHAEIRDRDAMERVLLTGFEAGYDASAMADMLFAALTDHYYLDGGHSIDFVNKAFELLDEIGWMHAPEILPSLIPGIVGGSRMEETSSWRLPVDLKALLDPVFADLLAARIAADPAQSGMLSPGSFADLIETLLGDEPAGIADALADALRSGHSLVEAARAVTHAASIRIARFHTSNEFGDWISVLHTFSAANATRQLLQRSPSLEGARGIWHVAMHLYLNRFLNTPSAPLDGGKGELPTDVDEQELLEELLRATEWRQQAERAGDITYRYLRLGYDDRPLIRVLARILLREDGEFHSYQMLEASLVHYQDMKSSRPEEASVALVALARYVAGHAPTDRATVQTFRIAERLQRGEVLVGDAL